MNRKIKKNVLYGSVLIILGYIGYLYNVVRSSHSPDWNAYKNYAWILKDSVRSKLDTSICYSYVGKKDVYSNFHLGDYNILVWEFKGIKTSVLSQYQIRSSVDLNTVHFISGETLNKNSDLEITIRTGYGFKGLDVNMDPASNIKCTLNGLHYSGFYGYINRMLLSNGEDQPQIMFNYTEGRSQTLFLLYERNSDLYIVIINSEKPFGPNVINILNLK